jgi:hypothetical protein
MTFEELQQIAIEQNTRTFSIDCSMVYDALPGFTGRHFTDLRKYFISNACWEVLIKTQFPFQQIIPNIEFVHTISDLSGPERKLKGISFQFSLYITNKPEMTILDLSILFTMFLTYFDDFLIHFFNIPAEIKSSTIVLCMDHNHSLFQAVDNSKSF